MSFRVKKEKVSEKKNTYQTQPSIKEKFRPADAKATIENLIDERLKKKWPANATDYPPLAKDLADKTKRALVNLDKTKRYKFMV